MWFLIRFFESYCFFILDSFCLALDFRWFSLVRTWDNAILSSNIVTAIAFTYSLIVDLNFFDSDSISAFLSFNAEIEFVQNAKRFRATTFDLEYADDVESVNKDCVIYKIRILQSSRWNALIVICWIANEFSEFWMWWNCIKSVIVFYQKHCCLFAEYWYWIRWILDDSKLNEHFRFLAKYDCWNLEFWYVDWDSSLAAISDRFRISWWSSRALYETYFELM